MIDRVSIFELSKNSFLLSFCFASGLSVVLAESARELGAFLGSDKAVWESLLNI